MTLSKYLGLIPADMLVEPLEDDPDTAAYCYRWPQGTFEDQISFVEYLEKFPSLLQMLPFGPSEQDLVESYSLIEDFKDRAKQKLKTNPFTTTDASDFFKQHFSGLRRIKIHEHEFEESICLFVYDQPSELIAIGPGGFLYLFIADNMGYE